ncbi:MAG TPA: helix-turn-helix transcriptional regulator [Actinomycetota bacterium]|nr:helix-turn-helix transcriptional regulator [Actinomycetota bacterium]
MTPEEFSRLFETFAHRAFRLETLSRYDVPEVEEALRAFLAGAPKPGPDPDDLAWQSNIRAHAAAGRPMQRVHVIRGPLTDYLRFEVEWGYPDNTAAGEDIGILHVGDGELPELGEEDFWLFDDSTLVLMRYDEHGRWLGADQVVDPAVGVPPAPGSGLGPRSAARRLPVRGSVPLTDHRSEIASTLRKLRLDRAMTGPELADAAGLNQATISRIETGNIVPRASTLTRLLDALEAPKRIRTRLSDDLHSLHSELASWDSIVRSGMRKKQEQVRKIEAESSLLRVFQPAMIPGLLQTADYARRVFQEVGATHTAEDVEEASATRLDRQKVLLDTTKQFKFVITEGALRWWYCPTEVMVAQLRHVASLSRLTNVRLGVIPWTAQVPLVPLNPFAIFDDRLVSVETYANELLLRDPADLALYQLAFEKLDTCAEHGSKARSMVSRIQADYRASARASDQAEA